MLENLKKEADALRDEKNSRKQTQKELAAEQKYQEIENQKLEKEIKKKNMLISNGAMMAFTSCLR
jgi:peptidoglycan hydrolase CwlO-like protein